MGQAIQLYRRYIVDEPPAPTSSKPLRGRTPAGGFAFGRPWEGVGIGDAFTMYRPYGLIGGPV